MKLICVLVLALLCSGCMWFGNITHDVSNKPEAWGGFQRDQIYVLQQPVYLTTLRESNYDKLMEVSGRRRCWPEEDFPAAMPSDSKELSKYPKIRGILPVGDRKSVV